MRGMAQDGPGDLGWRKLSLQLEPTAAMTVKYALLNMLAILLDSICQSRASSWMMHKLSIQM